MRDLRDIEDAEQEMFRKARELYAQWERDLLKKMVEIAERKRAEKPTE